MISSKNKINYLIALTAAIATGFYFIPERAIAQNIDRNLRQPKKRSALSVKKNKPQNFNFLTTKKLLEGNKNKKIANKNKPSVAKNPVIPVNNPIQIASSIAGEASWYGEQFHGRTTASGEIFNQNDLTAAHPSLPFGTQVKVTNVNNGQSVVVRINDRGPFVGGRVIDLSAAAAEEIGLITTGVAPVEIIVLQR
jgi:rare lipoprotein A